MFRFHTIAWFLQPIHTLAPFYPIIMGQIRAQGFLERFIAVHYVRKNGFLLFTEHVLAARDALNISVLSTVFDYIMVMRLLVKTQIARPLSAAESTSIEIETMALSIGPHLSAVDWKLEDHVKCTPIDTALYAFSCVPPISTTPLRYDAALRKTEAVQRTILGPHEAAWHLADMQLAITTVFKLYRKQIAYMRHCYENLFGPL